MRLGTLSLPALFTFDFSKFDGPSGSSIFGYASIQYSGTGYICGEENDINNYSPTPPWGSVNSSGSFVTTSYDNSQLIEFALNLTRMGIDPYEFKTLSNGADWCNAGFGSVMVKTRQSGSSFTSNMDDFVGPTSFVLPELTLTATGTNINCINDTAKLNVTNNTGTNINAYYEWVNMSSPNTVISNSISFNPTTSGTYKVFASRGAGCLRTDTVTIVVQADKRQPVATVNMFDTLVTGSVNMVSVYGGNQHLTDSVMAIDASLFGPSLGLQYLWQGPSGYTSTLQNPNNAVDSGLFRLIVTEPRNGCKDTANGILVTLALDVMSFNCSKTNNGIELNWQTLNEVDMKLFEIWRSNGGPEYAKIGEISTSGINGSSGFYQFLDKSPLELGNIYKLVAKNIYNKVESVVFCSQMGSGSHFNQSSISIAPNPASATLNLNCQLLEATEISGGIFDTRGRKVAEFKFDAGDGLNTYSILINQLPQGVYFVNISGIGIELKQQFIKQ